MLGRKEFRIKALENEVPLRLEGHESNTCPVIVEQRIVDQRDRWGRRCCHSNESNAEKQVAPQRRASKNDKSGRKMKSGALAHLFLYTSGQTQNYGAPGAKFQVKS